MGKFKESFANIYYNSQEDFFSAVEAGENEPTYVGLLEIVRVLKLVNGRKKKSGASSSGPDSYTHKDTQLCLMDSKLVATAGAS